LQRGAEAAEIQAQGRAEDGDAHRCAGARTGAGEAGGAFVALAFLARLGPVPVECR
jgi:hypothetical protein